MDSNIKPIIQALDFTRYTNARIGKAFEDALAALEQDMSLARYEPSNAALAIYSALNVCIQDVLEEISEIQTVDPETPKPSFEDEAVALFTDPPLESDSDDLDGIGGV